MTRDCATLAVEVLRTATRGATAVIHFSKAPAGVDVEPKDILVRCNNAAPDGTVLSLRRLSLHG
jgi:hypothetical protein